MTRILTALICVIPGAATAQALERPIPEAQSSEAEWLYLIASIVFVAALIAVQRLVARR